MTTVYQRFRSLRKPIRREALTFVGEAAIEVYKKRYDGELPPKVKQREGINTFNVYGYPDDFVRVLDAIIHQYYKDNPPPPGSFDRRPSFRPRYNDSRGGGYYRGGGGYRDRRDGGGYNRDGGGYNRDPRDGGGYNRDRRDGGGGYNRDGGGYNRDRRDGGGYNRDRRDGGGGYRDRRDGGGYNRDYNRNEYQERKRFPEGEDQPSDEEQDAGRRRRKRAVKVERIDRPSRDKENDAIGDKKPLAEEQAANEQTLQNEEVTNSSTDEQVSTETKNETED